MDLLCRTSSTSGSEGWQISPNRHFLHPQVQYFLISVDFKEGRKALRDYINPSRSSHPTQAGLHTRTTNEFIKPNDFLSGNKTLGQFLERLSDMLRL
jgi:hypothetical protein